ncbi:MAG: hypothetical protein NXH75_04815 [Halobacteriovoraceae bacterium]|nr:hypothetical protein [Halobacteriovoraceae bacterium]
MKRTLGSTQFLTLLMLLIFQSASLFAHDKIVLLTSLDPEKNRPPLRFESWNINEKLEKRFRKYLRKMEVDLTPVVKHFSTADDLYETLSDDHVKALIWVGHAGFQEGQGISQTKTIVDYQGRDLKNLFQAVGPNLRYLGLVGCRGKLFLEEWNTEGWFKNTPHLLTYGRKVKTDARKGLRLAMKELKELYKKKPDLMDFPVVAQPVGSDEISILRSNRDETPMESIQILQRGKLIGYLPSSDSDQTIKIRLNLKSSSLQNKIISDSGFSALGKADINMGILDIEGENSQWKLFQTATGKPIGVGKHIYRHTHTERR